MSSKLNPIDLYDIRSELSEDEIMVQDSVGKYVDEKVIPLMSDAFEKHHKIMMSFWNIIEHVCTTMHDVKCLPEGS